MGKKWNTDKAPVENILSLYTLLLFNYKKYSLRELSDYLNVSKSTTLRYLDQLEKADFGKVLSEKQGRETLYYFERIHDLPKIALNPEALEQLAICHDFSLQPNIFASFTYILSDDWTTGREAEISSGKFYEARISP